MSATVKLASAAWAFARLTAWSMIGLGVIGFMMGFLLGFLSLLLFNEETLQYLLESPEFSALPAWLKYLYTHFWALALGTMVMSVLTLIAGVGLLMRRHWALWFSIGMFWLGAAGNAVGIWLHAVFVHDFRTYAQGLPEWVISMIESNYWSTQISGALFGAVFAVGFGWTAWKLNSIPVRNEFRGL
jgi:hypothetical protein